MIKTKTRYVYLSLTVFIFPVIVFSDQFFVLNTFYGRLMLKKGALKGYIWDKTATPSPSLYN